MPRYDLGRESFSDPSDYTVNPRVAFLNRRIQKFRKKAQLALLGEYPELKADVLAARRELAVNKRSLLTGAHEAQGVVPKPSLLSGIAAIGN